MSAVPRPEAKLPYLVIEGQNFGAEPTVYLGGVGRVMEPLPVLDLVTTSLKRCFPTGLRAPICWGLPPSPPSLASKASSRLSMCP